MTPATTTLLLALWLLTPAGYRLPDARATPGVTVEITTARLCATRWGRDHRHVTASMKRDVCRLYGAAPCPGPSWEVDHLIARELGGADDLKNLWPQPIGQAKVKDRLENALHREVCAGTLTLDAAQEAIRGDWTKAAKARGFLP